MGGGREDGVGGGREDGVGGGREDGVGGGREHWTHSVSPLTGCKSLKVLKLGHVKVGDEGMRYLLPLEQLEELDLSHTLITSTSLHLLPEGEHYMGKLSPTLGG